MRAQLSSSESDGELDFSNAEELKVGAIYKNKEALKLAVCHYALRNHFNYKVEKSCNRRYYLTCLGENCKWSFRASAMGKHGNFTIRMFKNVHDCSISDRFMEKRQANSFFISKVVKKTYQGCNSYYGPKDIKAEMKNKYGVEVDYSKAWRARELVTDDVLGNKRKSYNNVPTYLYLLEQSNPGTITRMKTLDDGSFLYTFIALSASVEGFKFCRPQVVVDGAFLTTAYGGTLLTACMYNQSGGILPLAFGIVDSENNEAYHWFFDCFKDAFGYKEGMCFISDQEESIAYGIVQVYPEAGHYYCIYHLENNIKKKCKKSHRDLHRWFFKAAKAYTMEEFDECMMQLMKLSKSVVTHITEKVPFEKWAALFSKHYRRQAMTSNIAESLNSKNKKCRDLPITALLEQLRSTIQEWSVKFKKEANYTVTPLTDMYHKKIFKRIIRSQEFQVLQSSENVFSVKENNRMYVVDLEKRRCSCCKFQIEELPCRHAVSTILKKNMDIYEFFSPFYMTSSWKLTYAPLVHSIPTASEYCIPDEIRNTIVRVPARKVRVGRIRKNRFRAT